MKKPFTTAAWSGVLIIAVILLQVVLSEALEVNSISPVMTILISLVLDVVLFSSILLFIYGFVALSKRYNNRLLELTAWIGFVVVLFTALLVLLGHIKLFFNPTLLLSPGNSTVAPIIDTQTAQLISSLVAVMLVILVFFVLFALLFLTYLILFGIGLLKVGKDVKLAKLSGILTIVGAATIIVFGLGFFILFFAFIVEIVMFYKLSKKYESKSNSKENKVYVRKARRSVSKTRNKKVSKAKKRRR